MKVGTMKLSLNGNFAGCLSLLCAALAVNGAWADTATSQVVADSSSVFAKIKEKTKLSYYGELTGPALNQMDSAYYPTAEGVQGDKIYLYNSITMGYRISPALTAFINPRFDFAPVMGGSFNLLNPRVGLSHGKVIDSNGLTLSGKVDVELPATQASQDVGMFAAPAVVANLGYAFPDSRFSVGSYFALRGYTYHKEAADAVQFSSALTPYVDYKILSNLSFNVTYELDAIQKRGQNVNSWLSDGTNLRPGISWDVTDNFNLNPYLILYPTSERGIATDNTTVGLYISGAIL